MSVLRNGTEIDPNSIWSESSSYFWVLIGSSVVIIIATVLRSITFAYLIKKMVDWLILDLAKKLLKTKQSFFDTTPG